MATILPSPDLFSADPPTSTASPPSPTPSLDSSTSEPPPPSATQPNQTSDPPVSSTPSAPSPASSTPASPPPSPTVSSPPPQSSPSPPPPSPPASPPPSPPASPPPSPPAPPPPSPPAPTPSSPPPAVTSPPPSNSSPPPPSVGSPPPQSSPPPPSVGSPPPQSSPPPPAANPPPSPAVSPSPPPPAKVVDPPSSNSPPPPAAKAPKNSPPPPSPTPPPVSQSAPPPSSNSSSTPTLASPPPSVPSSSPPPSNSPPAPPSNSSSNPTITPLPSIPTEKPTASSGTGVSENAASARDRGLNPGGGVAIGVVSFMVLSLLVLAAWFVQKRRKKAAGFKLDYNMPSPFSSQNSDAVFLNTRSPAPLVGSSSGTDFMYSSSDTGVSNTRSWFTYQELVQATDGFSAQHLLGEGGFGCVYKGVLTDGREVAVKQLKIGGGQGEREFRAEVEIISRVHHRHLVSLVGYCISDHQRLLVYDFVQNDTLYYHLHGHKTPVLDWATRVKVAAGAARGIAYLHEDCHPRIIHRDIKSSNILLDSNFEAQVADFGLARLALDTCTHVSTRVMGTFGYMAPEYATSGKLTEKSDVYSYGVVLLELITGRKPVDDSQPLGDESLVEWARPLLAQALDNGGFEELVDQSLEKNYVDSELFRMIETAAACVRHSAAKRPRMSQVVRALDSLNELSDISNGMRPGQSEIYDSAEQSAQIRMFRRMAFGSQNYSSGVLDQSQSSWESREQNI